MAVTTSVLSGTVTDVIGDMDPKYLARVVLAIEANTDGSLLLDTTGKRLMAGAKRIAIDKTTGAYTVTLVKTNSTDVIPSGGRLYRAYLQYPSGIPGAGNVQKYSGWFELTADGSLSDADKWPGLEVTAVTQALVDSIGNMQADVQTRHGEVMGVVATNEGIMTSVLGSGGTFDAELSATYVPLTRAATDTQQGIVELATTTETATGTDTVRAVTPAGAAARYQPITFSKAYTTPYNGVEPVQSIQITTKNTGPVTQRRTAWRAELTDHATVNQVNITGATNAAPIVITAAAHGYATGDRITVQGVLGNTAANGIWDITVLTANTFSLNGSTGNAAYTSGGYVTNRSMMTAYSAVVGVNVARGGLTGAAANGDDANGYTLINSGNAIATDGFYIASSPAIAGNAWTAAFNNDARAAVGFRAGASYTVAAAELCGSLLLAAPNGAFGSGDVRIQRTGAAAFSIDNGAAGAVAASITGTLTLPSNPGTGTDSNLLVNFAGVGTKRLRLGAVDSAGVGFRTVSVTN